MIRTILIVLLILGACAANAKPASTDATRYTTTSKLQLDNGQIIYSWLDEQVGVVCFGNWSDNVYGAGVGISCVPLKDTNYALPIGGN